MKKTIVVTTVMLALATTGCVSNKQQTEEHLDTNTVDVNDRVVQIERGVVLQADAVEVTNKQLQDQANTSGRGLMAAGAITAASGHGEAGAAIAAAGLLKRAADTAQSNEKIPATRYTVEIAASDKTKGGMLEIFQIDDKPIDAGTLILAKRYSSGKIQVAQDHSQGVVYERTEETQYEDTKELEAKEAQAKAEQDATAKAEADKVAEQEAWAEEQQRRRIEAETKSIETMSSKTGETIDAHNKATVNRSEKDLNVVVK